MAVVAKKDIQTLTKQLIQERVNILKTIKQEHVAIEPSFLSEKFAMEVETKMNQMQASQKYITEEIPIRLDDLENIAERFDNLDKRLAESKASKTTTRKENCSMKRFGSMTDVNKNLSRSQSSQNLNINKKLNTLLVHAPKMISDHNSTSISNNGITPKITANDLSKHNLICNEIKMRLDLSQDIEENHHFFLSSISHTYKSSFDRLNKFCEEVQKIQTNKTTEFDHNCPLKSLDQNFLNFMEKLSKAIYQIRFIAENQNIYTTGIKEYDSLLSDDLTDILEHFYRVIK